MLQALDQKNKEFALKQFAHFMNIGNIALAEPHFLSVMRYTFREVHRDYDALDCDRFMAQQRRDWTRLIPKLESSVVRCDSCNTISDPGSLCTRHGLKGSYTTCPACDIELENY